jgi:hypothetical protein
MTKIPRRMVLTGLASVPFIAKLTRPNRPASAQTGLEAVSVKTPSGRTVSGVVAVPATVPAPAVLLIHGSGGLVDVYKGSQATSPGVASLRLPLISLTGEQPRMTLLARSLQTKPTQIRQRRLKRLPHGLSGSRLTVGPMARSASSAIHSARVGR